MCKIIVKNIVFYLIFLILPVFAGCFFISGEKAIHKAAYKGNLEKVKQIIEKHPTQINVQDSLGKTPLYFASTHGYKEIVEFLLAYGADSELANFYNERPLTKAAEFGHYDIVKILLEHGAKVNCKDDFDSTPLHDGARKGNRQIVDILLLYGADINSKDKIDETPLHQAARRGNIENVKSLVEHGADLYARDKNNQTPKDVALQYNHKEIVLYLQATEDEKKSGIK